MESSEFIISSLNRLSSELPGASIRYKYFPEVLIHAVEFIGMNSTQNESIEKAELDLLFAFIDLFPDENLGFVREGSELQFDVADWTNSDKMVSFLLPALCRFTHHFANEMRLDSKKFGRLTWDFQTRPSVKIWNYHTLLNISTNVGGKEYFIIDSDPLPLVAEARTPYDQLLKEDAKGTERCEQCVAA